jgi:hypothetical protein
MQNRKRKEFGIHLHDDVIECFSFPFSLRVHITFDHARKLEKS